MKTKTTTHSLEKALSKFKEINGDLTAVKDKYSSISKSDKQKFISRAFTAAKITSRKETQNKNHQLSELAYSITPTLNQITSPNLIKKATIQSRLENRS